MAVSESTDLRVRIERSCEQFAAKVWNKALDMAIEEIIRADTYRDAVCRVRELKIQEESRLTPWSSLTKI